MTKYRITVGNKSIEFSSQALAQAWSVTNNYSGEIEQFEENSQATAMSVLEDKADKYIDFGERLWKSVKKKIWAINTFAASNGQPLTSQQMATLLSASDMIQKALETGSFNQAKQILAYLKNSYPNYSSIADYATTEINTFLGV